MKNTNICFNCKHHTEQDLLHEIDGKQICNDCINDDIDVSLDNDDLIKHDK